MTYNTTWTSAGASWQPAGDYLLDWDVTGADGAAVLASATGAQTIGVTVSTPTNGQCDAFTLQDGQLFSTDVSQPTISEIAFDAPVSNVNFQLIDVDAGCVWDDQVTVLAYDPDGNLVEVDFAPIAGMQSVSGNTIEGEGGLDPQSEADLPADGRALLTELAALRSELRATADRAARLEKRLRRHLQEGGAA